MFSRLVGRGPLLNSGRGFVATSARHGANNPASTESNPDTGREENNALPKPEIDISRFRASVEATVSAPPAGESACIAFTPCPPTVSAPPTRGRGSGNRDQRGGIRGGKSHTPRGGATRGRDERVLSTSRAPVEPLPPPKSLLPATGSREPFRVIAHSYDSRGLSGGVSLGHVASTAPRPGWRSRVAATRADAASAQTNSWPVFPNHNSVNNFPSTSAVPNASHALNSFGPSAPPTSTSYANFGSFVAASGIMPASEYHPPPFVPIAATSFRPTVTLANGRPHRDHALSHRAKQKQKKKKKANKTVSIPLQTFAIIENPKEDSVASDQPLVQDVKAVGSYSWTGAQSPTIVVPGHPPIWADRAIPFTIRKDRGRSFIDQNGHRLPRHPLLPLVATLEHLISINHPSTTGFKFTDIDLVTDRNGLRKLAEWAGGATGKGNEFTIDVECAGRTVLFTRREPKTRVKNQPGGYGHSFENATTTTTAADVAGYHRMITYTFGGLQLLVRCETDACLPEDSTAPPPTGRREALVSGKIIPGGLTLITGGAFVDQSRTVELKTRALPNQPGRNRRFGWQKSYIQMVIGQTQQHVLGWQRNGTFTQIQHSDLAAMNDRFSMSGGEEKLKKLAAALPRICEEIRRKPRSTLMSLVCEKGVLSLRQRGAGATHALPDVLLKPFEPPTF